MDARNLTAIPHSDAGSLEVIVPDGGCGHTLVKPRVSELSGQMALSSTNRNSSYP